MVHTLAINAGEVIPIIGVSVGGAFMIIMVIATSIRRALATRQMEQSRREIAAYVAEGSMSADDGYKLLAAGRDAGKDQPRC